MKALIIYNLIIVGGVIIIFLNLKYADREINKLMERGDEEQDSSNKFKSNNRKTKQLW